MSLTAADVWNRNLSFQYCARQLLATGTPVRNRAGADTMSTKENLVAAVMEVSASDLERMIRQLAPTSSGLALIRSIDRLRQNSDIPLEQRPSFRDAMITVREIAPEMYTAGIEDLLKWIAK